MAHLPPLLPGAPSYPPGETAPPQPQHVAQQGRPLPNPAQAGPAARARPPSGEIPYRSPPPQAPFHSFPATPPHLPPATMNYPGAQPQYGYTSPPQAFSPTHPTSNRAYPAAPSAHQQQPAPQPAPHQYAPTPHSFQSPAEVAAAQYHATLVAYYLGFAMQGIVAPAEDDRQGLARQEAIETARRAGVNFGPPPGAPPVAAAPIQQQQQRGTESWRSASPAVPTRSRTLPTPQPVASPIPPHSAASTAFAYAPVPHQGSFSPLPPTTPQPLPLSSPQIYTPPPNVLERSTSARQPFFPPPATSTLNRSTSAAHSPTPAQYVPHQAPPRPSSAAASPSVYPRPDPFGQQQPATYQPPPTTFAPHPPPSQPYQSGLARNDSVASVSSSYAGSNVSIASNSSTGAAVGVGGGRSKRPLPLPPGRSATLPPSIPTSPPSIIIPGSSSVTPKRPLPAPRGPAAVPPPGSPSLARRAPEDLLRDKMAGLAFHSEASDSDRGSTPTPPLLVFGSPTSTTPTTPTATRPRSPSISISFSPTQPPPQHQHQQQHQQSRAHPHAQLPQPPPARAPPHPNAHPRNDPSHPSHALYHPSSSTPLEAGAVRCARCREVMYGRALMAFGGQWHPDCFRCDHDGCGTLLEHVEFDGKDGEVFCMVHYEERFAATCFQCKTPIADQEYLTISDESLLPSVPTRTYHALHFFCASCGDPFVDPKSLAKGREGTLAAPYMVHDGYAYCRACDVRLYAAKCKGCRKGIGGDYLDVLDGMWHPECFGCGDCKRPLDGQYLLKDDKALCVSCYELRIKNEAF